MKRKRTILLIIGNLVAAYLLTGEVQAQRTDGYIYGRVKCVDRDYVGRIRWGDEETYWFDMFNAAKLENEYYQKLSEKYNKKKKSDWTDFDWSLSSIWEDKLGTTHQFGSQFGDIKSLKGIERSRITVLLKNNKEIELSGSGYNDVGTTLQVYDHEIGEISIRWDRIVQIDFMNTPSDLPVKRATPIYGTVETFRKGTFTGFIQWDHDERVGTDKLDGDDRNGDVSIPFADIRYIEKKGNGCSVELNSGREFYLTNSNDVDDDNRGIIMFVPGVGHIDIPFKYFNNVKFEKAPNSGPNYQNYKKPNGLYGTVYKIDGSQESGRLIFDLDETWELEMLDGNDDDVEYQVPFWNIKSIEPKNYAYSMVKLRNGDQILLGGSRDVSDDNDGILVTDAEGREVSHVSWDKIVEIVFD